MIRLGFRLHMVNSMATVVVTMVNWRLLQFYYNNYNWTTTVFEPSIFIWDCQWQAGLFILFFRSCFIDKSPPPFPATVNTVLYGKTVLFKRCLRV